MTSTPVSMTNKFSKKKKCWKWYKQHSYFKRGRVLPGEETKEDNG